jgi:anti-sigma regulatory factor (Ser/Thr protein kinase)
MLPQSEEIHFLDSFKADTYIVRLIIDRLMNDLDALHYDREEREEIVLAMDEAVTNAVQETLFLHKEVDCHNPESHEITVRYHIGHDAFDATIIDHGKGLDLERMLTTLPNKNATDYRDQLYAYAQKAEGSKLRVRLNGKEVALNGIGAGLKIMLSFMDELNIDLIDKDSILSTDVRDSTEGSIVNMQRKRRYM